MCSFSRSSAYGLFAASVFVLSTASGARAQTIAFNGNFDAVAATYGYAFNDAFLFFNSSETATVPFSITRTNSSVAAQIWVGSNNVTFAGEISAPTADRGGIIIGGAGTVTFAAAVGGYNSAGTLLRQGGTVRLLDGASTAGAIGLEGDAVLHFEHEQNHTFASEIYARDGGRGSLLKSGAGTTRLTNLTSLNGGITVQAGTLEIEQAANTFLFAGQAVGGAGDLHKSGAGTLQINGAFTLGGSFTVSGGTVVLGGGLDRELNNAFLGAGTVVFEGGTVRILGENSGFEGRFVSGAGNILIEDGTDLGEGRLGFSGGGLRWAAGSTRDISANLERVGADDRFGAPGNSASFDTNGNDVGFAAPLLSDAPVTKLGVGQLTLHGPSELNSTLTISGGSVVFAPEAGEEARVSGDILGSGSIAHDGAGTTFLGGMIENAASSLRIDGGRVVITQDAALGWAISSTSGDGILEKRGGGVLEISGDAAHTGGIIVEGGELALGFHTTLPTGNATSTDRAAGLFVSRFSAPVQLAAGARLGLYSMGDAVLSGDVSGAGAIGPSSAPGRFIPYGRFIVTGDWTHTGGTNTMFSQLRIGAGGVKGSISGDIHTSVSMHAAFRANDFGNTALYEPGLVFDRSDDLEYGGRIFPDQVRSSIPVIAPWIEKRGPGTLTLTGLSTLATSYADSITRFDVREGTLRVEGSITNVFVHGGAALDGGGTVYGQVNLADNASFSPGASTGLFTVDGDFFAAGGSRLRMDIGGGARGVSYDALVVSGAFDSTGVLEIVFVNGFVPTGTMNFTLFSFGGTSNFAWSQLLLPTLNEFSSWDFSRLASEGILGLTVIPEPSTYATIFGLCSLAGAVTRRRRVR